MCFHTEPSRDILLFFMIFAGSFKEFVSYIFAYYFLKNSLKSGLIEMEELCNGAS